MPQGGLLRNLAASLKGMAAKTEAIGAAMLVIYREHPWFLHRGGGVSWDRTSRGVDAALAILGSNRTPGTRTTPGLWRRIGHVRNAEFLAVMVVFSGAVGIGLLPSCWQKRRATPTLTTAIDFWGNFSQSPENGLKLAWIAF